MMPRQELGSMRPYNFEFNEQVARFQKKAIIILSYEVLVFAELLSLSTQLSSYVFSLLHCRAYLPDSSLSW